MHWAKKCREMNFRHDFMLMKNKWISVTKNDNRPMSCVKCFVAFYNFFPDSLTVFHRGKEQNDLFIFWLHFKRKKSPKNATKYPVT